MKKNKPSVEDDNAIEASEADYLYIQASALSGAGQGLFTAISIYREEVICIYTGEILSEHQIALRVKKNQDKYFILMLDGSILDSMKTNCFAKYANDAQAYASSGLKNNAKITINEAGEVCLTATRNIKVGEEIYCDYGRKYWKKHAVNLL
jgi:SET domain-containing protein